VGTSGSNERLYSLGCCSRASQVGTSGGKERLYPLGCCSRASQVGTSGGKERLYPLGCLGRIALMREQCEGMAEHRNDGTVVTKDLAEALQG
jgi:hypothetical protein